MKRILYADILRVLAIFAVIILHCVGYYCNMFKEISLFNWFFANSVDSLLRFCVPVFVMLSGMLLLGSEKEFNLRKRASRIVIPLICWSIVYIMAYWWNDHSVNILKSVVKIFRGPVAEHLWFPYMLFGLYLLTPLIKPFVKEKKNMHYILILLAIFSVIFPLIKNFTGFSFGVSLGFGEGYIGYYILGYYLHNYTTFLDNKKISIPLFIVAYLTTVIGTYFLTQNNNGVLGERFYSNFSPNVILTSVIMFMFIKNNANIFSKISTKFIEKIGEISYGVYLSHVLFVTFLFKTLYVLNPIVDMLTKSI
ncbi:MAG: acyltransferase family protein, partial [Candidatus Gracilibacteria bacterium]|nr:acyltransferase family protein [Candidatus Gracilibacteria bacterium]